MSGTTALLPAPTTDPAPLVDIAGGETNLLHRTAWSDPSNPLKVTFDRWENSAPTEADPEYIRIYLDGIQIGEKKWSAPIGPNDLFVPIGADKLPSGEHSLTYVATIWSGTPHGSDPFTITVDKDAPLLNTTSQPQFPASTLPPNQITAAYLADPANEDKVLATVPIYNAIKVGDVITWYWENSPTGQTIAGSWTLGLDDLSKPLRVSFSGDVLRSSGNGGRFASYRVRDRAGNESPLSSNVALDVSIRPPIRRGFPKVSEATSFPDGTGQLNPFLGASGVKVVVDAKEVDPGEALTVDFIGLGGEGGIGSETGVQPITAGGLEFAIAAATVAANIPVNNDGRKVEVRYWAGNDTLHSEIYTLRISELAGVAFGQVLCPLAQIGSPATLSRKDVPLEGAALKLNKWAYQARGQLMNVWVVSNGVTTDLVKASPLDTDLFSTWLPQSYVHALELNTIFAVHASVSFDQGQSYRTFKEMSIKVVV